MSTANSRREHPSVDQSYSVTGVRDTLTQTLRGYIQAQYHIRNVGLIRERARLLEEVGSVSQLPFVEATPIYESGAPYRDLDIPAPARDLLSDLSALSPGVGIFERPYIHQAQSLETFLGRSEDLVVATGTGSGKTECFLMPILGQLAIEGTVCPEAAKRPAVRALLLYPMNALVADQLARVRRLFGDPRVADRLQARCGRRVRFGTYTSRTAYPGPPNDGRNESYLEPIFEKFYLQQAPDGTWSEAIAPRDLLRPSGRWPCKDLVRFYAPQEITTHVYGGSGPRAGKTYRKKHWDRRLQTQLTDTELLTRQEIQAYCPDLLITNYSMLEYMLLRPIERSIFTATRNWLATDPRTVFILVIDEAHTYRGAGGAEVALLIRRLRKRLDIPRERFRCILTSASLGSSQQERERAVQFARNLTGLSASLSHRITLAESVRETRVGRRPGTAQEATALAAFDLAAFQNHALGNEGLSRATAAVTGLATRLSWPRLSADEPLEAYLFHRLTGFGPVEELIGRISGSATEFAELARSLFPDSLANDAEQATEVLLALVTFARFRRGPGDEGRVLMPARLHLFFRGLPKQFICTGPECTERRVFDEHHKLGRIHTQADLQCPCGGRLYELLTHRSCGTAFLRGYLEGQSGTFLWHEPSGLIGSDDPNTQLCEVELLVEPPHADAVRAGEVIEVWLDGRTGRLELSEPPNSQLWVHAYLQALGANTPDPRKRQFARCPVCRKNFRKRTEIMDLVTKGEAPFSNLIKAQVLSQPPRCPESVQAPNGGRKSLVFSDGRQKAARLARDIPREVEQDSFRQALALAVLDLQNVNQEARPTTDLYVALVGVAARYNLAFFDRHDQRALLTHSRQFTNDYEGRLEDALADRWTPNPVPNRYREALLRQLCSRFYSLASTTIGYVAPSTQSVNQIARGLESSLPALSEAERRQLVEAIAFTWMARILQDDVAFDATTSDAARDSVAGFPVTNWGSDATLPPILRTIVSEDAHFTTPQLNDLQQALRQRFCAPEQQGQYRLDPNRVRIVIDLASSWWQCQDCTNLSPTRVLGRCINCGSRNLTALGPESEYIQSRKGFWRDALQSIIDGRSRPAHICAEEHTAQLSHHDEGIVYATTERHELRFQDIVLSDDQDEGPIDVLSCTTTMEVGIDIGSLVAVGLRNVPPQRENYQQRAGRTGRRGSSVSTVVTFAQGGPHDNHYFVNPAEIVSGRVRQPVVHTDNPRIAARHVAAYLFQTFFHQQLDQGVQAPGGDNSRLDTALGETQAFLLGAVGGGFTLPDFRTWVDEHVISAADADVTRLFDWLPEQVAEGVRLDEWIRAQSTTLLTHLERTADEVRNGGAVPTELLLDCLFDSGVLPTYAFPTDLASFVVERQGEHGKVETQERPQLAVNQALSEYAPGRLVVIDKVTYRSGGVAANVAPTEVDRAVPLFGHAIDYVHCQQCSFVGPPLAQDQQIPTECPLCHSIGSLNRTLMITPEVFHPDEAQATRPTDRDQDFSYASTAQFPVPVDGADVIGWRPYQHHAELAYAQSQPLVVVNRGDEASSAGFWVCDRCGAASLADGPPPPRHPRRPYLVQRIPNQPGPGLCQGQFRQVYLGNQFRSDLMLLRVTLNPPFNQNSADRVFRCALEDAMFTLSEAMVLGASRSLDIDPAEFNAGYRIWHPTEDGRLRFDLYLFDTLSGGAGYAEEAGRSLDSVLAEVNQILGNCTCSTSCQECLRHYGNRIHHERLDRFLAAHLLGYILSGILPTTADHEHQVTLLQSMERMFSLDGFQTERDAIHNNLRVPLMVSRGGKSVVVGTYPGLLDANAIDFEHPLTALDGAPNIVVSLVNDYRLTRNLPGAYQQIRQLL